MQLGISASLGATATSGVESPPLVTNTKSIAFDGSDDFIALPSLTTSGSITVACWFKMTSTTGQRTLLNFASSSNIDGIMINSYSGRDDLDIAIKYNAGDDSDFNFRTTNTFNDSSWHHIAVVKSSSTIDAVYIDGDPESRATPTLFVSLTAENAIGNNKSSTNNHEWVGNIDEVAIWSSALTATEVEAIYDNLSLDFTKDSAGYASSSNLKGWWRMGDGQNTLDGDDIIFENHTKTIIDSNITLGTTNLWATAGKSNMALGTSILNDAGDSYSAYNGWGTINGTVTAETDATDGNYIKYVGDGSGTTLAQLVTAHSAHAGKIYKSTFEYRCNYYVMFSNNGYVTDNVALPRTTDSAGDSISSGDAFKTAVVYFKGVSAYIGNFRMNADANVATNTPADAEFNYKNWTMYELSDNNLGTMTNMTNADFESDVPS